MVSDPVTPISVLVVDDNNDAADTLAWFLRNRSGFRVRVAYDGEEGIKMAFAEQPDVVVCDVAMPRLSGWHVAEELSSLNPRPLLITMTAFGVVYTEDLAHTAGFDHYLTKPTDPYAIERLIKDHFVSCASQ